MDDEVREGQERALAIQQLREAIRLTREYVGERTLPAFAGWEWFDAIAATGGVEGFGRCGCVLDPQTHGRTRDGELLYCRLPAGHDGEHGPGDDCPFCSESLAQHTDAEYESCRSDLQRADSDVVLTRRPDRIGPK